MSFEDLMTRGGPVMWPLLVLSMVAVTLIFERCWFFVRMNRPARLARARKMAQHLRRGEIQQARGLATADRSVYGDLVLDLLDEPGSEAAAAEAVAAQHHRLERFLPTLSTIITVAPMLGILGTVLGIIASFELLGSAGPAATDPRQVGAGIAEALITTAFGLMVAVVTLFPYNAFRAQVERTLTRIDALSAAAGGLRGGEEGAPH